jgi:tRNA modification GTPase
VSGDTRIAVLTPTGTGAIATVEVSGPGAWELVRHLFRPAGKPLPDAPALHHFWFGKLGIGVADEVILAVTATEPQTSVEIHCHGGRRVVQWVVEQFIAEGASESKAAFDETDPWQLLTRASTLRTAAILLDQAHGAFATSIRRIVESIAANPHAAAEALGEIVRYSVIGHHLVEPWQVAIAGPPNVGKSSLVNALAGFQRAIVSEIAGTTRDAIRVQVAFDGWPVELTDTAGLRNATGLEAEGIERAKRVLREADLVVWVMDSSQQELVFPDAETAAAINSPSNRWLIVMNKSDIAIGEPRDAPRGAIRVSATTKSGIPELIAAICSRLVPNVPSPSAAVPFTPQLAKLVCAAHEALTHNRIEEAIQLLRDCQTVSWK